MTTLYLALGVWVGGLVSWGVTAAFDYSAQAERVSRKLHELRGAAERDPEYGKTLGDLQTAAQDRSGGPASWSISLSTTYAQPLLVALITGLGSFLGTSPVDIAGPLLGWVALTGVALVITILDARMVDGGWTRRPLVIVAVWVAAFSVFTWLAVNASNRQKPTSSPPPVPTTSG